MRTANHCTSFQGCPQRQFRLAYALSRRNVKGGCQTVGVSNAEGIRLHHQEQHVEARPSSDKCKSCKISLGLPCQKTANCTKNDSVPKVSPNDGGKITMKLSHLSPNTLQSE